MFLLKPIKIKNLTIFFCTVLLFYSISIVTCNSSYAQNSATINTKSSSEKKSKKIKVINVLVIGDSLTSGHGLELAYSYANILQRTLRKFGYPVNVINGSVAGSTTSGAHTRLRSYLRQKRKYSLVIIAIGYNDIINDIPYSQTARSMEEMLEALDERNIPSVIMGMKAPPNIGKENAKVFNQMYNRVSTQFNMPFYPFFLEGIAMNPKYNLSDGVHPNIKGINIIVQRTAPIIMYAVYEILNEKIPVKYPKSQKRK